MVVHVVRWFTAFLVETAPTGVQKSTVEQVAAAALPVKNPEHSPVKGEETPRIIIPVQHLLDTKAQAKKLEWQTTLDAIISSFGTLDFEVDPPKNASIYLAQRLERILGRADKKLVNEFLQTDDVEAFLKKHGLSKAIELHAHELLFERHCCFSEENSFEDQYYEFEAKFLGFKTLVAKAAKHGSCDPETFSKAIWSHFRELLEHPAYKLMRCDESNDIIRRLHDLAIGAHAYTESIRSYQLLGDEIQKASYFQRSESFSDILSTSRLTAAESGFLVNDPPSGFRTSLAKARQVIATFFGCITARIPYSRTASVVATEIDELFFATQKDYRSHGNLPSHYYTETFSDDSGGEVDMRVIMHASPTKGGKIVPEFLALLQAIENGTRSTKSYVYTNLQNRFEGNERWQSEALMKLNERFPTAFYGITLNSDGLDTLPFDENLPEKMLKVLLSEQSFTLHKTSGASNYYFPPHEKEKWHDTLTTIVKNAYKVIQNDKHIDDEYRTQSCWELVNSDIIRYREVEAAANALNKGKKSEILVGRSCIVCVDRGPKEHSKQLVLLGADLKACAAIHLARGPEAKGRLPVDKRVKEAGRFLKSILFRKILTEHFRKIGLNLLKQKNIHSSEIRSPGLPVTYLRSPSRIEFSEPSVRRKIF